jgi:tetratricopeptide (TPR) repeat protein
MLLAVTALAAMPAARADVAPTWSSELSVFEEARQLLGKRKWEEAAIAFGAFAKRNPSYMPANLGLAAALVHVGRREEALGILTRLARQEKRRPVRDALIRKIRAVSRIFLTSTTFQIYQDGLNFMAGKKYRAAREKLSKAVELEPDNVEVLARLGQCLLLDKDYDSAAERLRLARRLDPYEPQIGLWLARALYQRGELEEALAEFQAVFAELDGTSELAPGWYADSLFIMGHRAAALKVLDEHARANPFHVQALIELARMQVQTASRDREGLWNARKNLQLALSRIDQYSAPEAAATEGPLGLTLKKNPEELRTEIQRLFEQIDSRLEEKKPPQS